MNEFRTFDLSGDHAGDAYKLLAGLVTPRPIALVSTIDAEGRVNAAPYSFFNVFGSKPAMIAFAPGNRSDGTPKDTALNIAASGDFVVNLVDEPIAEAMSACSADLDYGTSELEHAGLTATASDRIASPRIAEAPVALECRELETLTIGGNRMVIGQVELVHVREGVLDPGDLHVRPEHYRVIGRMHGADGYTRTRDQFAIPRG